MSSHHFVKEGQEPALFILEATSLTLIEPLLEWAPLVMVNDEALHEVLRWGIKIDVAVVKISDKGQWEEYLTDQMPLEIISYPVDESSLQAACQYLIRHHQKGVNIITEDDKKCMNACQVFISQLELTIFGKGFRWMAIPSLHFEKWVPAKSRFLLKSDTPLIISGLTELNASYEAIADGMINVRSSDIFWVGEPL